MPPGCVPQFGAAGFRVYTLEWMRATQCSLRQRPPTVVACTRGCRGCCRQSVRSFVDSLPAVCRQSIRSVSAVCPQCVGSLSTVGRQSVHRLSTVCPKCVAASAVCCICPVAFARGLLHLPRGICPQFVRSGRMGSFALKSGAFNRSI